MKWVLDYSCPEYAITRMEILAFLHIQMLAQYYQTSATQLFRPSQRHSYIRVGNYISEHNYQKIMSALNNSMKRREATDDNWNPVVFRNDEMIKKFDCFSQDCTEVPGSF